MEMKFFNPGLILLGLALAALLAVVALVLRRKNARRVGVRVANTARLRALPAYRRRRAESLACRSVLALGLAASLVCALCLAARPCRRENLREEVWRRDIFLCMDISASGCEGLSGFVEALRDAVKDLEGDQIGVCLFNTSSVQFVPVTEDYRYVGQRLGELADYCRAAEEFNRDFAGKYAYAHEIPEAERARYEALNAAMAAFDRGATAGYEVKGTSAVGEGLAACLFSFPELREEARPRTILFVTDNHPEIIGFPLVTLQGAADMCAYDGVTVYGVYTGSGNEGERAGLGAAVEATGGRLFELSEGREAILAALRGRAEKSRAAVATHDTDAPEPWRLPLFAGLGLVCAALAYTLARTGGRLFGAWPLRRRLATGMVALAALACAALIAIRPMRLDENAEIRTTNLDICFAVDTTISMWAEDGWEGKTRMDCVREDVATIMNALPGSSFSLIRFDNGAQTLAPYIRSVPALEGIVERLTLPSYATAEGSTPNAVHEALEAMLRASRERSGARKAILFVMGDGEITDGSELMPFDDLARGVDDGAVLGYGTREGGRMNYPGKGYIQDSVRQADALSVIDEENLEALARDLGVSYVARRSRNASDLGQVLSHIRRLSRSAALREGDRTGWQETYYYFAGILALILMGCLFRLLRRGSVL